MFRVVFFTLSVFLTIKLVNSRVFYVDTPKNNYYSFNPDVNGFEQASKDLDMTFSAGDLNDNDHRDVLYPINKILPYSSSDGLIYDQNYDLKRPIYHRSWQIPTRKLIYEDPNVYVEKNRKLLELNDSHKGEVVLELRVIANNKNSI